MIKSLSINNYALIQSLEMTPSPKLNIITGETGAGKSIMLGAIGLLLGHRADTRSLFSEEDKCVIEGVFDLSGYDLKSTFEESDLDYETECIIRREISPTGKSRAFVNDTPVTLDILKVLGTKLIDIHSQHESLELGNNRYQEEILDLFSRNEKEKKAYSAAYTAYKTAEKRFLALKKQATEQAKDLDYKQYLYSELEDAKLLSEELAPLEEELEILEHAETIKTNLGQLSQILDESEYSVINQLKQALPLISSIRKYGKTMDAFFERLNSASIEIQDLSAEITREQHKVEDNPERLQAVKERLDLLNRLLQKHQVKTMAELISIRDVLAAELHDVLHLDEDLKTAEAEVKSTEAQLLKSAGVLTASRSKHAEPFAKEIEKLVHKLGIENASIIIQIKPATGYTPTGLDQIDMLFSANKGVQPRELKHVASGGEFSRLIFAVKYLLADKTALPTIIFDEIDTGVSGEVALQMVSMMKQMAQNHQVISISHLPQFAAGGDYHYYVYKDHSADVSVSRMKKLDDGERVMAIARMIGGDQPGDSAIASARDLLKFS